MYTLLPLGADYEEVYARFRWSIPQTFNIAVDVCDRHAGDRTRLAMIYVNQVGDVSEHTFAEFHARSCQFAHVLSSLGVTRGDRVAILLPQRPETAVAHLTVYRLGAIALPLSVLFGPEAIEYRLGHAGAKVVVTDAESLNRVLAIRQRLPDLAHVVTVDCVNAEGVVDYRRALQGVPDWFESVRTGAEDPALLFYTSGTTGSPKGVLHASRVLLGRLPSAEFYHEYFPKPGDCFWSPADWAWAAGLFNGLLQVWHYGVAVIAHRARKFEPELALELASRHRVRNTFLLPTVLRMMMREVPDPRGRYDLRLRTIHVGGESVGEDILLWAREALGVMPNEGYGQTEVGVVLGNCSLLMPVKAGSMGRAVPGHVVDVVNEEGCPVPAGEIGEVAVHGSDPGLFLGYWHDPKATRDKFVGDCALTGDLARRDADGYFWFVSRKDDVISSGGYRIGPSEVEQCLSHHPAVAVAAVVGSPDPIRGEVVKAFVQLREGVLQTPELVRELAAYVRIRLSAHEYPREIECMDALPMTTTGKVKRDYLRQLERERKHRGPA